MSNEFFYDVSSVVVKLKENAKVVECIATGQ